MNSEKSTLPTLVCLPGVNSGTYLFDSLQGGLRVPGWRVVALDPPGTGATPLNLPCTAKSYAESVLAQLPALGVTGAFALLGHSFGGMAAQELARLVPERVERLILVSTTRGQPDMTMDMLAMPGNTGMSFWGWKALNAQDPVAAQKIWFGAHFVNHEWPKFEAFLQARAANYAGETAVMAQTAAGGAFSSVRWVRHLKMPTLVVHGTADVLVRPTSGQKLAAALPNGRWLPLHEVGHFPMLEHPKFAYYVGEFLSGTNLGEPVVTHNRVLRWLKDWMVMRG
jgi:poly(3-hydroxyoctanoate) depolymerase